MNRILYNYMRRYVWFYLVFCLVLPVFIVVGYLSGVLNSMVTFVLGLLLFILYCFVCVSVKNFLVVARGFCLWEEDNIMVLRLYDELDDLVALSGLFSSFEVNGVTFSDLRLQGMIFVFFDGSQVESVMGYRYLAFV